MPPLHTVRFFSYQMMMMMVVWGKKEGDPHRPDLFPPPGGPVVCNLSSLRERSLDGPLSYTYLANDR